MCLVCGEFFCIHICQSQHAAGETGNQSLTLVGNACRHARDHHNGTSVFIECDSGMLIIYEGSRCDANSYVYSNKFGEPIRLTETVARYSIQNYTLDKAE